MTDFEVGDKVIVKPLGYVKDYVSKVARLTKTLVILETKGRFRRQDGFSSGRGSSGWGSSRIIAYNQEDARKIRRDNLIDKIHSKVSKEQLSKLNDEELEILSGILL